VNAPAAILAGIHPGVFIIVFQFYLIAAAFTLDNFRTQDDTVMVDDKVPKSFAERKGSSVRSLDYGYRKFMAHFPNAPPPPYIPLHAKLHFNGMKDNEYHGTEICSVARIRKPA
jgi:hypothetical protein